MEVFQPFVGYYFFNSLLLVLQFLHIFWAWLILRMIYKFLFLGQVCHSSVGENCSTLVCWWPSDQKTKIQLMISHCAIPEVTLFIYLFLTKTITWA